MGLRNRGTRQRAEAKSPTDTSQITHLINLSCIHFLIIFRVLWFYKNTIFWVTDKSDIITVMSNLHKVSLDAES